MFRDLHQHAKFMSTVVYSQTQFIQTLWECSLRIKRVSVKRGLTVLSEVANDLSYLKLSQRVAGSLSRFFQKLVWGVRLIFVFYF